MKPIQVILLLVVAGIIGKVFQKFRSKLVTVQEFFLWVVFWLLISTLFIFPNATQAVADMVGIGRGVDLVIYGAIIVLFAALFFMLVRIEKVERDITRIVRKLSLDKKKSHENSDPSS